MKSAQTHLNARAIRADRLQGALPALQRLGTAFLFFVVLTGTLVAADGTLRLARELPDVVAEAEIRARW